MHYAPMPMPEKEKPDQFTHPRDWSLEGNRPIVSREEMPQPTTNDCHKTGLIVRQPL